MNKKLKMGTAQSSTGASKKSRDIKVKGSFKSRIDKETMGVLKGEFDRI